MTWLLIIVVFVTLVWNFVRDPDLLNPLNLICLLYLIWFGFSPLYILENKVSSFSSFEALSSLINYAEGVALMGFLAFTFGYFLIKRKRRTKKNSGIVNEIVVSRAKNLRLISLVFGTLAAAYYFSQVGGISHYWLTEVGERYKSVAGRGYIVFLTIVPLLAAVFTFVVSMIQNKTDRFAILFIVVGFLIAISTGSRGRGILPLLLLVFMMYYITRYYAKEIALKKGKIKQYIFMAIAAYSIFYIGTILMEVRRIAHQFDSLTEAITAVVEEGEAGEGVKTTGEKIYHITLSYFFYLKLLDYLESSQDYRLGATIAQSVLLPIPRAIWPGKPSHTPGSEFGAILYHMKGNNQIGTPYTYIGDLYWNFHILGVVFGMFVLGLLTRRFYEWFFYHLEKGTAGPVLFFGTVAPVALISFSGTFYGAADTLIQYIAFLFLFYFICKKRVSQPLFPT